jgi:chemotaxis family two-component system sensor kinase Cph1
MVRSYSQLLKQKYASQLDADANKFIDIACDGATRMQALIEDLLEYAKMGETSGECHEIDCNDVVAYVKNDLETVITEKQATITIDNLPNVYANEVRLARLFLNLIGNAIKYSKADRKPNVHIAAEEKEDCFEFSVKDNGIGMRAEYLEQIFEPFKRLHGKNEYPGTGIGLAICYKIVERLGGRIWANSEIDKGSTIYFTIPKNNKEQDEQ